MLSSTARQIRAALTTAPDSVLGRVVGVLDALGDRQDADELLAEIRPRLRRLRPARPMRFGRLLALPLEGALVAPAGWTGGAGEIPRFVLPVLTTAVRAGLGEVACTAFDAELAGRSMEDAGAVATIGGRLWQMAGALPLPSPPPGWKEAGLPAEAAGPVLDLAGALWRHGGAIWAARRAAAEGPPEALLRATFGPLAAEGQAAVAAAALLLLREASAPARVAWVAASFVPGLAGQADKILVESVSAQAAALAAAPSAAEMAEDALALVQRLEDMEAQPTAVGREERRRLAVRLRRDASTACLSRLAAGLQSDLMDTVLRAAAGPGRAEDRVVMAIETLARDLRRLEVAGRRLGQEAAFDRLMAGAVPPLVQLAGASRGLNRVEIARLIEILAGAERAMGVLAVEVEG